MLLAPISRNVKNICYLLIVFFLILILQFSQRIYRLASSHTFNLNHPSIFKSQFQIYILTRACDRLTADIASTFPTDQVILVPDIVESPTCASLDYTLLPPEGRPSNLTVDDAYRSKYARVLDHCEQGNKMKCLIFEDDVILLHDSAVTQEILVEQTMTLFNNEESAWDCTKRGFGWVSTSHTGMGSQCRIYSRMTANCMSVCLMKGENEFDRLDSGLRECQKTCGLEQKRFLLAVHSGLPATIVREPT